MCSKNYAFFSLDVLYAPRLPDIYFWCVLYSRFYGTNSHDQWCCLKACKPA